MADRFLGLDLGTSSLKALVVDASGAVLGQGSAAYAIGYPRPDCAEQDPEDWWRAAAEATRLAVAEAGGGDRIAAIGLAGQMHGTVLIGETGDVLAPAVVWADQRTVREVAEITDLVGGERLIELCGSAVATGFQAATVRWFQRERPELWARTWTVLTPKGYLGWRLTGVVATEPSDASGTLLLDVRRRDWSPEVLSALEIPRERLPPVRSSTEIVGRLVAEAASALGLEEGLPVVAGAGDAPAAALGAGIVGPETMLLALSTGAQVLVPAAEPRIDYLGRVHTFCGALPPAPGQVGWYQMGATLTAGLAMRWLRDRVFALDGADADERMMAWAAEAPVGAGGVLFLPYLVGERTPLMDPAARGVFVGLAARHGRAEMVRATMEGVTLAAADAFGALQEIGAAPERIVLAGGGARSALWRRVVADVFGLPVVPLATEEHSALGAALLAAAGVGAVDPLEASLVWARYGEAAEPDARRHARYVELVDLFRRAYVATRAVVYELESFSGAAE